MDANNLGVVSIGPGFILARDPDVVRAPDIAFVRAERLALIPAEGWAELAPDLAVEVVSPSDTAYQVEEKVEDFLTLGCLMVVVVSDHRRTVTVYRPGQPPQVLRGNDVFDAGEVVPGFRLPLPDIFA